jgi:hypothetical protein
MRPMHPACRCEFQIRQSGVSVLEISSAIGPYRLWKADLWACPRCQTRIISGYGAQPYSEHWQPGFAAEIESARAYGLLFEAEEA